MLPAVITCIVSTLTNKIILTILIMNPFTVHVRIAMSSSVHKLSFSKMLVTSLFTTNYVVCFRNIRVVCMNGGTTTWKWFCLLHCSLVLTVKLVSDLRVERNNNTIT